MTGFSRVYLVTFEGAAHQSVKPRPNVQFLDKEGAHDAFHVTETRRKTLRAVREGFDKTSLKVS